MSAVGEISLLDRRLDTWKEIANFFRCDERTVKRWEAHRGLPVHRLPGGSRSKVYAYTRELRTWLEGAGVDLLDDAHEAVLEAVAAAPVVQASGSIADGTAPTLGGARPPSDLFASADAWARPKRGVVALVAAVALCLAAGVAAISLSGHGRPTSAAIPAGPRAPRPAPAPEAVQLYLQGLHDWNTRTPAGLNRAVDEFTQAIVRDPGYAEAYVGLANCYNLLREYTVMSPAEAYPRAKAAAERAVALDDNLAGGHTALAFVDAYWTWDSGAAEREFRRALQLEPNSAQTHHWFANFLNHLGRSQEAMAEMDRAQELDPNSSAIVADKAWLQWQLGGGDAPIQTLTQLESTNPGLLSPHRYLAFIYFSAGETARYAAELRALGTQLNDASALAQARALEGHEGRSDSAAITRLLLPVQLKLYAGDRLAAYDLAVSYLRLGDRAKALTYLELSVARHEDQAADIAAPLSFKDLAGDPRFERLRAITGGARKAGGRLLAAG